VPDWSRDRDLASEDFRVTPVAAEAEPKKESAILLSAHHGALGRDSRHAANRAEWVCTRERELATEEDLASPDARVKPSPPKLAMKEHAQCGDCGLTGRLATERAETE